MPPFIIKGGATVDIPSAREVADLVAAEQRAALRGIKVMRLPQISGKASGSALSIGAAANIGPAAGYAWSLRRVIITGMTTGATPDVVNLYTGDVNSQPLWQFNGNNFGYTFGKLEQVIQPGEILLLASVGTFAATGIITMSGSLVEVPAEMLAKLA